MGQQRGPGREWEMKETRRFTEQLVVILNVGAPEYYMLVAVRINMM